MSIFINGQLVVAGFSLRMWLGIRTYSETQPEGCGYLEKNCPEGATSSGRSPGRGVDSYMFKSENLSLTFENKKCHAEPCAELDSVLVQHLVLSKG